MFLGIVSIADAFHTTTTTLPDYLSPLHPLSSSTLRGMVFLTPYPAAIAIRACPAPNPADDSTDDNTNANGTITTTLISHLAPRHYSNLSGPSNASSSTPYLATGSALAHPASYHADDNLATVDITDGDNSIGHGASYADYIHTGLLHHAGGITPDINYISAREFFAHPASYRANDHRRWRQYRRQHQLHGNQWLS